jgi:hypothetical protein
MALQTANRVQAGVALQPKGICHLGLGRPVVLPQLRPQVTGRYQALRRVDSRFQKTADQPAISQLAGINQACCSPPIPCPSVSQGIS